MSDSHVTTTSRRSGGRTAAVIVGSLLALVSLGFLAAGGAALWANGQKDDDGYLKTRTERFHTARSACASRRTRARTSSSASPARAT
jgi:hypothetical protein